LHDREGSETTALVAIRPNLIHFHEKDERCLSKVRGRRDAGESGRRRGRKTDSSPRRLQIKSFEMPMFFDFHPDFGVNLKL
jgi:hypothetical protein